MAVVGGVLPEPCSSAWDPADDLVSAPCCSASLPLPPRSALCRRCHRTSGRMSITHHSVPRSFILHTCGDLGTRREIRHASACDAATGSTLALHRSSSSSTHARSTWLALPLGALVLLPPGAGPLILPLEEEPHSWDERRGCGGREGLESSAALRSRAAAGGGGTAATT